MTIATLLVPGLFEPPDPESLTKTSLLDHLCARGELTRESARGYEELLAEAFGLETGGIDIPSGALLANLQIEDGEGAQWACVAPVYLHVDRDRLILVPVEQERIDSSRVRDSFNAHFADGGLVLHTPEEGPWLLRLAAQREVGTSSLDQVAGRSLDPFLPVGADAAWLRSLMNECQMLLHQLEVAEQCNSFWIWGFGTLPVLSSRPYGIAGNSQLVKAFLDVCPESTTVSGSTLHVIETCMQGRHYGDHQR